MVKDDHVKKEAVGKGHDFYHALRVADCARRIAPAKGTATLAWIAGVVHNTDHLFGKDSVPTELRRYLSTTTLTQQAKGCIVQAVVNHSNRNSPEDSPVQICLMDADKVVCLEADVIIRAAQFMCHLPIYDPRFVKKDDPDATYRNPKTIIRDLKGVLEWVDQDGWFRTRKALAMAKKRATLIRTFLRTLAQQLDESGMLSPKFPENHIV